MYISHRTCRYPKRMRNAMEISECLDFISPSLSVFLFFSFFLSSLPFPFFLLHFRENNLYFGRKIDKSSQKSAEYNQPSQLSLLFVWYFLSFLASDLEDPRRLRKIFHVQLISVRQTGRVSFCSDAQKSDLSFSIATLFFFAVTAPG